MNPKPNLKTIAVWQPYFMGGGAEAVSLWILEALAPHYDVTLFTLNSIDLERLDALYNTHLTQQNITVKAILPQGLDTEFVKPLIANISKVRSGLIHWSVRVFKELNQDYDLVLSTYNGLDMGRPGIQYLHWVHVVDPNPKTMKQWGKILMKISDFSRERLQKNITLANSQHTAKTIKQAYGIDSRIVYPPVVSEIEAIPWEEKEDSFLCSGRIVRPKQPHQVIEILQQVRDRGFDVKLQITGGGGGAYQQSYERRIKKIAAQNSDWIQVYQDLPYKDYLKILARCRYGLHQKPEPFGISVAEMVKAGMIPFVRNKGGQVEIVGTQHQELLYHRQPDAVEKIVAVLENKDKQQSLLNSLKKQQDLFSVEQFMKEIQAVVAEYFHESE
jgi:glycosyltransferase involved in cell wall biosynthesis